ncbi:universal stress protein [Isoptericola aurantiacus]|uniref:universal stress protein n=1 Tax=Isoptericola aurantiacus TaxID=3377839 RepID=UPI00383A8E94
MNTRREGVVVGVDGSAPSNQALDWAAAEAVRRHTRLTVVNVYEVTTTPGADAYGIGPEALKDEAEDVIARAADRLAEARERCAGEVPAADDVGWRTERGSAAGALVELSGTSDLVVVGRRGLHGLDRMVLGSVSAAVSAMAKGPVAVVPYDPVAESSACPGDVVGPVRRVVAAVDFDDHLGRVLDLAFDEAHQAGSPLVVVHALESEFIAGPYAMETAWVHRYQDEATTRLEEELGRWHDKYPSVEWSIEMAHGSVVDVLGRRIGAHDLVVVGGRRHSPIVGRLLRSDADRLGRNARCPLLVAHAQR